MISLTSCYNKTPKELDRSDEQAMTEEKKEFSKNESEIDRDNDWLPDYNTEEWVEIVSDNEIILDIKYAQTDNFTGKKLYECPRCFLRPHIAEMLYSVSAELTEKGYKLILYDCYRPKQIQEELWNIKPDKNYVTPPWKGSMHNKGLAIDLSLMDKHGRLIDMGTAFDHLGEKSHLTYKDFPAEILSNRQLLKTTMEKHGFSSIRTEWWHYSAGGISYPISDWQWKCR
jgi:D-alanyl-D-alanine dipeptidase